MNYRPATIADIHQCERLDGSYVTDYVWQMEEAATADSVGVTFRRTRTPRRMDVPYPRDMQDLYEDWQRNECFLVAEELGSVYGLLDMTVRHWRWHGWIEHLVVDRSTRDRGLATRLLASSSRSPSHSSPRTTRQSASSRGEDTPLAVSSTATLPTATSRSSLCCASEAVGAAVAFDDWTGECYNRCNFGAVHPCRAHALNRQAPLPGSA